MHMMATYNMAAEKTSATPPMSMPSARSEQESTWDGQFLGSSQLSARIEIPIPVKLAVNPAQT
jgi:hypothetical protein